MNIPDIIKMHNAPEITMLFAKDIKAGKEYKRAYKYADVVVRCEKIDEEKIVFRNLKTNETFEKDPYYFDREQRSDLKLGYYGPFVEMDDNDTDEFISLKRIDPKEYREMANKILYP